MNDRAPTAEDIEKASEFQGADIAQYLADQARILGPKRIAAEMQNDLDRVAAVSREVDELYGSYDVNGGIDPDTRYRCLQEVLKQDAVNAFFDKFSQNTPVEMLYRVDKDSGYLRGFRVDGQLLDQKQAEQKGDMDKLDSVTRAWLAKNQMFYRGGVLFQANDDGEILTDDKGNEMKVPPEDFIQKSNDAQSGIAAFMRESGLSSAKTRQVVSETVQAPPKEDAAASAPQTESGQKEQQPENLEIRIKELAGELVQALLNGNVEVSLDSIVEQIKSNSVEALVGALKSANVAVDPQMETKIRQLGGSWQNSQATAATSDARSKLYNDAGTEEPDSTAGYSSSQ